MSSEKAMALWIKENTPENSLLVAGFELPLYWYYTKPRKALLASDNDRTISYIKKALKGGGVFAFSNSHVEYYKSKLKEMFTFRIIDIIPAWNLRKQQGAEFLYLNFVAFSGAERIKVYKLELNDYRYYPLGDIQGSIELSSKNKKKIINIKGIPDCEGIRIESVLANSINVTQGERIAEVIVSGRGMDFSFNIRAGIDTSEWAFNRPDVKKIILHRKAKVSNSTPQEFEGNKFYCTHTYFTETKFTKTIRPKKIRLNFCYTSRDSDKVVFVINKIEFIRSN